MLYLLQKFLQENKYFFDETSFSEFFLSHPDYPSLFAVNETLSYFAIENLVAKVSAENFSELPDKFLTTLGGNIFVYVAEKDENSVVFYDEKLQKRSVKPADFLQNWSCIVLVVNENKNPKKNKRKIDKFVIQNLYSIFALLFLYIIVNQIISYDWLRFFYSLLSLLGLFISVLIVQESLGFKNKFLDKICSSNNLKSINCNSIIFSKGAKIYRDFSLSDLCFIFFTTISMLLIFNIFDLSFYKILSILFIPIIIYYTGYQVFIRKFCPLCLGIDVVLLLIFFLNFFNFKLLDSRKIIIYFAYLTILFFAILFLWISIKPFFARYFPMKNDIIKNKRIKRNFDVFKTILNQNRKIDNKSLNFLKNIELGNPDSDFNLKIFISPSCSHCDRIFAQVYELINQFPDKISINIFYNLNPENPYLKIAKIIMQNSLENRKDLAVKQLVEWHINKISQNDFMKKYQIHFSQETMQFIENQHVWCEENNLNHTPIIILNEKLFPETYEITDLKFFVNVLT
jgi:hypothetical protein